MKPLSPDNDCSKCQGLCCIATTRRGEKFGGKHVPTGKPCQHLTGVFQCRIHAQLGKKGYEGCMIHDCHGVGQLMTSLLRSAGISGMPNVLHVLENKLPIITARQKEITQVIMYVFGLISNATTMLYDDVQEADFQKYKTMIDGFYEEFRKAIHDGNSMYIFLVKAWDIFQELEFHNYAKNNGILLAQRRKSAENNGAYARKYQDMLRTMSGEERPSVHDASLKMMLYVVFLIRDIYYIFPTIWKGIPVEEARRIALETAETYAGNNNSANSLILRNEIQHIFEEYGTIASHAG